MSRDDAKVPSSPGNTAMHDMDGVVSSLSGLCFSIGKDTVILIDLSVSLFCTLCTGIWKDSRLRHDRSPVNRHTTERIC